MDAQGCLHSIVLNNTRSVRRDKTAIRGDTEGNSKYVSFIAHLIMLSRAASLLNKSVSKTTKLSSTSTKYAQKRKFADAVRGRFSSRSLASPFSSLSAG